MNRPHTLLHIREALEELSRTAKELESDPDYDGTELEIALAHAYHHLNTAWNARNETEQRTTRCSDEDYTRWTKFPKDLDLSYYEQDK
ncbi:MAG: hypothetical protein WC728_13360 [Elusimicrobiota bacterium]